MDVGVVQPKAGRRTFTEDILMTPSQSGPSEKELDKGVVKRRKYLSGNGSSSSNARDQA